MKQSKGRQLVALLAVMLIVSTFVSTVSAKEDEVTAKIVTNTDRKTTIVTDKVTINLVSNQDNTEATLSLISENNKQEYRVKVYKVGKEYLAEIYDDKGTLLKTKSYSKNPLKSQEGEVPVTIKGILLDADIDIYPEKYSYNVNEEGTVNIEVDDFVFIPNYGIVYGPATVIYWWDFHLFDYNEKIKVKVKYLSSGTYQLFAFDHVWEIALGFSAYDDDSFSVNVS